MEIPHNAYETSYYGYNVDHNTEQPGHAPAYSCSTTYPTPLHYSYNHAEYLSFPEGGVYYHQAPYAPCHRGPTYIPVLDYSALRPSSVCDVPDQPMVQPDYVPTSDPSARPSSLSSYDHAEAILPRPEGGVDYYTTSYTGYPTSIPVSNYSTLRTAITCEPSQPTHQFPTVCDAAPARDFNAGEEHALSARSHATNDAPFEIPPGVHAHERGVVIYGESTANPSAREDTISAQSKKSQAVQNPTSHLNQRKAYFRQISDNVGFETTDPDTITSHDKKRRYLESLEEYVQWLHEQIRLLGREPPPLARIATYRRFKSRSLRTILVHKQHVLHELNVQKAQAEEKFMELQDAVLIREAAKVPFSRDSIET